jgi:hypothetical protein
MKVEGISTELFYVRLILFGRSTTFSKLAVVNLNFPRLGKLWDDLKMYDVNTCSIPEKENSF